MAYNGSVELISGIKQKNDQDFPLVDASAVRVDDNTRLDEALSAFRAAMLSLLAEDAATIPDNSDLDTYRTAGNYKVTTNESAGTISHRPTSAGIAFRLVVLQSTNSARIHQIAFVNIGTTTGTVFKIRYYGGSSWGEWNTMATKEYADAENAAIRAAMLSLLAEDAATIPDNSDLDTYRTAGNYKVTTNESAGTISHRPTSAGIAFRLVVLQSTNSARIHQIAFVNIGTTTGTMFKIRYYNGELWSDWNTMATQEYVDAGIGSAKEEMDGRLDDLETGKINTTGFTSGQDLNDITDGGVYYARTLEIAKTLLHTPAYNINYFPAPSGANISMRVENVSRAGIATVVVQTFTIAGNARRVYQRQKVGSNAWTDWTLIVDSSGYDAQVANDGIVQTTGGSVWRLPSKGSLMDYALAIDSGDVDDTELIAEYGSYAADHPSQTMNGVDYTWNSGTNTATIDGMTTGESHMILLSRADCGSIFEGGKAYNVSIVNTSDNVNVELVPFYGVTLGNNRTWVRKTIGITNNQGQNITGNNRICTDDYIKIGSANKISVDAGYKFEVVVYSGNTYSTFLGAFDGTEIEQTGASFHTEDLYLNGLNPDYYYRLVIGKESDANISTDEIDTVASKIHVYGVQAAESRVLENQDVIGIPIEYDPTATTGLVGYELHLRTAPNRTCDNESCTVTLVNNECNFAEKSGPWLGFTDYIPCPKYLIISAGETSPIPEIVLNFFYKSGDSYVPRHDILQLCVDESYNGTSYRIVNRMKFLDLADATNNRVIRVPDGTYVRAAMKTTGEVKLYGWDGTHVGPDSAGFPFSFSGSAVDYSTNLMGFRIPGDATFVWTKDAAIRELYGVSTDGEYTKLFEYRYHQAYELPKEYAFFHGNLAIDYVANTGKALVRRLTGLYGPMRLNDYLCCDSPVTVVDMPNLRSKDVLSVSDRLASVRWTCLAQVSRMGAAARPYLVGKTHSGIPYTSMWTKPTQIGWHISLHTLLNAINDVNSIFYKEHSRKGTGPGYGGVCTSFSELVRRFPWPIGVERLESDPHVQKQIVFNPVPGSLLQYKHHAIIYGKTFAGKDYTAYTIYEETSGEQTGLLCYNVLFDIPVTSNGNLNQRVGYNTNKPFVNECVHRETLEDMEGYNLTDTALTNGSARPYVGDRGVFCAKDSHGNDVDVVITIHNDSATTLYVQKCTYSGGVFTPTEDSPVTISIPSEAVSVVIPKTDLTDGGFYGVYTDADSVMEYFEYHEPTPITYSVEEDGTVSFSDVGTGAPSGGMFWYCCWDANDMKDDSYLTIPGRSYLYDTANRSFAEYKELTQLLNDTYTSKGAYPTGAAFYHGKLGAYMAPLSYQA